MSQKQFPTLAGIFLGIGLGGFFDGIVFLQILQRHHPVSNVYAPDSLPNIQFNTLMDELFHAATYAFVIVGLVIFWNAARKGTLYASWRMLIGTVLMGFGLFNLVEGAVNHHLLQLHHVNETAPEEQWLLWDIGFLAWGALMLGGGLYLYVTAKRAMPSQTQDAETMQTE